MSRVGGQEKARGSLRSSVVMWEKTMTEEMG